MRTFTLITSLLQIKELVVKGKKPTFQPLDIANAFYNYLT